MRTTCQTRKIPEASPGKSEIASQPASGIDVVRSCIENIVLNVFCFLRVVMYRCLTLQVLIYTRVPKALELKNIQEPMANSLTGMHIRSHERVEYSL